MQTTETTSCPHRLMLEHLAHFGKPPPKKVPHATALCLPMLILSFCVSQQESLPSLRYSKVLVAASNENQRSLAQASPTFTDLYPSPTSPAFDGGGEQYPHASRLPPAVGTCWRQSLGPGSVESQSSSQGSQVQVDEAVP